MGDPGAFLVPVHPVLDVLQFPRKTFPAYLSKIHLLTATFDAIDDIGLVGRVAGAFQFGT